MSQSSDSHPSPSGVVPGQPLAKLIRSKATRAFLTKDGQWTAHVQNAARFTDLSLARAAMQQFQLHDVELYYFFGDGSLTRYDFAIPLDEPLTRPAISSG